MSLFDSLGRKQEKPQEGVNYQQALQQLKSNPSSTLKQAGLNIPDNMNDPGQIISYLLQSGQISNPRLHMAQRLLGSFGRR